MKPVPEINKYYHFWDDGKTSVSRHYICRVERIITNKDAKKLMVKTYEYPDDNAVEEKLVSLYDYWQEQVPEYPWLYANETDYFIEISCPTYDDNLLYAVRTIGGGWFTMDIQSWWQGGRLDVDSEIYNWRVQDCMENSYEDWTLYVEANEENWKKS